MLFKDMINLAYSLSPKLNQSLKEIDSLRRSILLFPLSSQNELSLRWEARLNRLSKLTADTLSLTKPEIAHLLTNQLKGKLTFQQQELINYQKTLDDILENWLARTKNVNLETVLEVYEVSSKPSFGEFRESQAKMSELEQVINYLSHGEEHPVIKAAISFIEILSISPFPGGNEKVACLISYLYLYKQGFDIKGFLSIEDFLIKNVSTQINLTFWIEDYAQNFVKQLTQIRDKISNIESTPNLKYKVHLNERQKEILRILDNPEIAMANAKVQKLFKISQITASRDLAKLASLGLILAHGKGRSIYYIKL